jgi:hypothetical protein
MRRSASRRAAEEPRSRRRLIAAAGALVVFGAIIGVTQISNADDKAAPQTKKTSQSGLEILTDTCEDSQLEDHDGFQLGSKCVSTEFGEVGSQENNPTLLITEAPRSVRAGQPFQLKVSTRNLIRDRFLAAGQGGYYVESSVLQNGLVRGHFHTACRMLSSTREANDPAPVPAFFVATEDKKGGARPDTVTIQVPGMPDEGTAQCASWAGDGSHRVPMMQRANQTPAFDAVRIRVRRGEAQEQPPASQPPASQPPASQPPAPPAEEEQPPAQEQPPAAPAQSAKPSKPAKPQTNSGSIKTAPVTTPPADTDTDEDTTKAPATGNKSSNKSDSDSDAGTEAETVTSEKKTTTTTDSKKKATPKKSAEGTDITIDPDDGAPDPDPGTNIEPVAAKSDEGKLAFTGSSTAAMIGGGTVVLLIGFVILSATRRRRPRPHWHQ